ncbi:peptidyl-alpha-hydroxyglycine alpha-amidating lyase family protein [soil metagenome]
MAINKNNLYLLLFLSFLFTECNNISKANNKDHHSILPKYELVKDWPQLPAGYVLSQVTGIGVDTSQNIFLFHRTGRQWTEPFPDSLISANTVLLLNRQTGKLLESWGANLFIMPHGLTVDKDNNVWLTDVALHQVFKFSHDGKLLITLGIAKTPGNDSLHFNLPTDVAVAKDGSFYVSDGYGNSRIVKFSREGKYLFAWGKRGDGPGEFHTPHAIDLDAAGNVYVADRDNNRIGEFDANGTFLKEWKNSEAVQLYSLAVDKKDNQLFAIDYLTIGEIIIKGSDILQFDTALHLSNRFGRSGLYAGPKCRYHDIAVDDEGSIYVGDILVNTIQKFKKIKGNNK